MDQCKIFDLTRKQKLTFNYQRIKRKEEKKSSYSIIFRDTGGANCFVLAFEAYDYIFLIHVLISHCCAILAG